MVLHKGGVDDVPQWLSSLTVLTDAIVDDLEQTMEASPANGVFLFPSHHTYELRPLAAMMGGITVQGHLSSLKLTWKASCNEHDVLSCHLEIDVAHIRVDKDLITIVDTDHSEFTPNLELSVSLNRLHVVLLDSALIETSKIYHTLQQFMTLHFLNFPRATMHLVEVYNSKHELISVFRDLLHNRYLNLAATASTTSWATSKISTKIGNHMVNLFQVELVSSLPPSVDLVERPDIPLEVTVQKAEIMSLLYLDSVSLSAIMVGNSFHVLQVDVLEAQLIGSKERLDVWKYIFDAAAIFDSIEAPFAKISAMSCLVTMKSVLQAASTLPFDTVNAFVGDPETTLGSILRHYTTIFSQKIRRRLDTTAERTSDMSDKIAATVGCAAMHTTIATPIGLAASLVAVGVKDGITRAASVGKQARGESKHADYQFGDVTRGLVASFRSNSSSTSLPSSNDEEPQQVEETPTKSAATRYGAIGGSSVGAIVGLTLIGGPVGLLAGSLMGGSTAKKVINALDSAGQQDASGNSIRGDTGDDFEQNMEIPGPTNEGGIVSDGNIQATQNPQAQQNFEKKPYQFGDFTRGVVARGKRASRRDEGSSYQFGDFTRGLFS